MTEPAELSPAAVPRWRAAGPESIEDVVAAQVEDLSTLFDICVHELHAVQREIEAYGEYCARTGLQVDEPVLAHLTTSARQATLRLVRAQRSATGLSADQLLDSVDGAAELSAAEAVLRFGQSTLAYVRNCLEWAAKSYAQSHRVQFFGTQTEVWPTMHYDRNGTHPSVIRVERQLLELLGLSADDYGIGVTSSGMSAFSLGRGVPAAGPAGRGRPHAARALHLLRGRAAAHRAAARACRAGQRLRGRRDRRRRRPAAAQGGVRRPAGEQRAAADVRPARAVPPAARGGHRADHRGRRRHHDRRVAAGRSCSPATTGSRSSTTRAAPSTCSSAWTSRWPAWWCTRWS